MYGLLLGIYILFCIVGCSTVHNENVVPNVQVSHGTKHQEAFAGSYSQTTETADSLSTMDGSYDKTSPIEIPSISKKQTPVNINNKEFTAQYSTLEPYVMKPKELPKHSFVDVQEQKYKEALNTYKKHNYAKAIQAFEAFMEAYPKSRFMPNALYWKGECLYSQEKYAEAIMVFKSVMTKYPKHNKAPDSLLKIGMAYGLLGDKENADLHYRVLFEDYPKSTTIKTAKKLGIKP